MYNMVKVKYMPLYVDTMKPEFGSEDAAGADIYAHVYENRGTVTINPGETVKISAGIAVEIPEGFFGMIVPRSGLATKRGLRPVNTPSTIDADYRGEVFVPLYNESKDPQIINHGDRIAQMIIIPIPYVQYSMVDKLRPTQRGTGGFGSTGV